MTWEPGELRSFDIGTFGEPGGSKVTTWKTYRILAPYERIIAQLALESDVSTIHNSHETCRRGEYANRVLDLFGEEIESFTGNPSEFFSQVLTPILVRQLRGLHDDSSTTVRAVVAEGKDPATLEQATKFYLTLDPTDPDYIPLYRRQLLTLPIARWHLATVLGLIPKGHRRHYHRFYNDHVIIMQSLDVADPYPIVDEATNIPYLTRTEVAAIVAERLEDFFEHELRFVVRIPSSRVATLSDLCAILAKRFKGHDRASPSWWEARPSCNRDSPRYR